MQSLAAVFNIIDITFYALLGLGIPVVESEQFVPLIKGYVHMDFRQLLIAIKYIFHALRGGVIDRLFFRKIQVKCIPGAAGEEDCQRKEPYYSSPHHLRKSALEHVAAPTDE